MIKILWADDEADLLKPYQLFLEQRGYHVTMQNNAADALDLIQNGESFDMIFLDENMPGVSGMEALAQLRRWLPHTPVVMITKNDEEKVMEEAIGLRVDDYLIKPVNPTQILLILKKHLQKEQLVEEKTTLNYQQQFRQFSMKINDAHDFQSFEEIYKELIYWEMTFDTLNNENFSEMIVAQKEEANALFAKYVEKKYASWFLSYDAPILSHSFCKSFLIPQLRAGKKAAFVLIDNLRYDQWKMLQPIIAPLFAKTEEHTYASLLPTTTQYARNALFAGLTPLEIYRRYPAQWSDESDEGSRNQHEEFFLEEQLKRSGLGEVRFAFHKINHEAAAKKALQATRQESHNLLNVYVFNFIDILSHARTETKLAKELFSDDKSYRAITETWFRNSSIFELLEALAKEKRDVLLSTDHGTIRVQNPIRILADRETSTNLRYKRGKKMTYKDNEAMTMKEPEDYQLPKTSLTSTYVLAHSSNFFAYPNNFNHYVQLYKNTFQHGGISMEEMLIPAIWLKT